jgi:hypothetical protein
MPLDPPTSRPSSRASDDLVDHVGVVRGGPEVLADALDEVGAPGAAGVDRALGVGADDAHAPLRHLLEVPADAADGAAGADAGHEVRDLALGVAPDLGAGGLVVAERAVGVGVLVGLERAGDLAREPVAHRVVGVGVVGRHRGGRDHDLGAVGREHVALVLADLVGEHEHAAVAALLGDEREADAGVAGGRLDDGAARLQLPVALGRVDDARGDAVLGAAARVQVLDLHQHGRRDALDHPVQLDERGVPDEVEDRVGVLHVWWRSRV